MSREQVKDFFVNGLPEKVKTVITMLQLEDLNEIVLRVQTHMELSSSSALPTASSDVSPLLSMTDIYQSIQEIKKVADSHSIDIKSIKSAALVQCLDF